MVTTDLIVRFGARVGKEEDVAAFLRDALETLTFTVGGDRALDAFYHPFAHLPTASLDR